jgi:hypothetical protein
MVSTYSCQRVSISATTSIEISQGIGGMVEMASTCVTLQDSSSLIHISLVLILESMLTFRPTFSLKIAHLLI